MDIVIVIILVICAILLFRRFDNTVIFFGLVDIFFRIVNFVGNNTTKAINNFVDKYFPSSIESIIRRYSSGTLETILVWIYVSLMALFFFYVLKMLWHRKK